MTDRRDCPECKGRGRKVYGDTALGSGGMGGQILSEGACPACHGTGKVESSSASEPIVCDKCGGDGELYPPPRYDEKYHEFMSQMGSASEPERPPDEKHTMDCRTMNAAFKVDGRDYACFCKPDEKPDPYDTVTCICGWDGTREQFVGHRIDHPEADVKPAERGAGEDIRIIREWNTLHHCQINKPTADWHPCGCDVPNEALDRIAARLREQDEDIRILRNANDDLARGQKVAEERAEKLERDNEGSLKAAEYWKGLYELESQEKP